jgi:YrbI family 3-deoxy-D-manno-octulosonate 8-phosphate phosphatase
MVDEDGRESVVVSRADGQAVHLLRSMGIELVIMSTETNGVVGQRAKKLGVECVQSVSDKADCLRWYCEEKQIPMKQIAYIGNDVNDYGALQLAGMKIVPQDAYNEVKNIADYVTETKGGYGVIREVAEIIRNSKKMQ